MPDWLCELPLWIPIALAIAGLVLLWTGLQRLEDRLKLAGLIIVIVAIALGLLSWFLESDREIVVRQTRELVASIDKRNWNTTEKLLHPDFNIGGFGLADLKRFAQEFDLQNLRIFGLNAAKPNPKIIVNLRVLADLQKQSAGLSVWQLEWEKTGAGWQLINADPEAGLDPATIKALIPTAR